MAWFAFILALVAITGNPSQQSKDNVEARLQNLEKQTCTMMVVKTPSGEATICAQRVAP